jgi:hypothetical protein
MGLAVASFWWSTAQQEYFPWLVALEGILLGGILATPFAVVVLTGIWFAASWLERHVVMLCLLGPLFVWGISYLLNSYGVYFHGDTDVLMPQIMIASTVASGTYYALYWVNRRRNIKT